VLRDLIEPIFLYLLTYFGIGLFWGISLGLFQGRTEEKQ
jgi:hypothetical protein